MLLFLYKVVFPATENDPIYYYFAKTNKIARVQFGVFEKFTNAYFFQIAWEKSGDYLLII